MKLLEGKSIFRQFNDVSDPSWTVSKPVIPKKKASISKRFLKKKKIKNISFYNIDKHNKMENSKINELILIL